MGDTVADLKHMDVREFREGGYLQEINRRLLHPLGLALEVLVDDDGTERLGGIWDCRDDPEGITYGDGYLGPEFARKEAAVEREWKRREAARRDALGFMVQPTHRRVHEDARLKRGQE